MIDDIDRISNQYFELCQDYDIKKLREDEERMWRNMAHNLVPYLMRTNQISEEDYAKWALDETGKFLPKLKQE